MRPEVIDYCYNNFHDGLNFEIYNYFIGPRLIEANSGYEPKELQAALNNTLVEFTNVNSMQRYINAFGKIDYTVNGLNPNCTVKPNPNANYDFEEAYKGPANNGSDENWIYKNNTFNNQSTESEE